MTTLKQNYGKCPNKEYHTPHPEGYLQWHEWANKMSKTHEQKQCPGCGLWAIWEPKGEKQNAND